MIYVDVSEARAVSRLHPKLALNAHKIVGLEAATGADILISTLEDALPGNVNRPPGSLLFKKHVESGMLIQRKTGSDALNSIPNMHNLIARMRASGAKMCWLLVTGYLVRRPETNKVLCEGRPTDWHWVAYQATLDAWQVLGGYTHYEPDDLMAVDWILSWDRKLPLLLQEVALGLAEKPLTPKLGSIDPHPERVTLMTFPGCGDQTSNKIMDRFPSLASCIEWMSQPFSKDTAMYGVGEETIKGWRRWLGLLEGEVMSRILLGGPTIHAERSNEVGKSEGKQHTDYDGSTSIPKNPAARQSRPRNDLDG